ncbi:uncharacterized protein L969DRAFT_92161 [Mixia osmundae IAM 14324]|uniref:Exoribonuclease phosphorolytic domain-containing protein n=1 Tax=Mixia osmundae (strain CBS 9802 / IAM 14324 / JCM 22182 / KY 12970) TaxID=764103 RepID=G7DT55_MIXOS|nr:uncharacterized protein L969DRAFT_92161 [Mixia osmundae IAM 14324]KEI42732.1 hypothetical protein L969DRAFT_92161 [Mixia osmundae IAM 14324]GAA93934.1 hypothetical protein E5Q_00580 [Mixia osmundae IAM 14324]
MRREDGRSLDAIRSLRISLGQLSKSDGSASFSFGQVSVLAAVRGPQEVSLKRELADRAALEITVLPVRGLPGPAAKAVASMITPVLVSLLLLHAHPRSLLQLTLQTTSLPSSRFSKAFRTYRPDEVLEYEHADDEKGGPLLDSAVEKAAAFNASMLSLLHASSVGMRGTAFAVALALLPESALQADQATLGTVIPDASDDVMQEETARDRVWAIATAPASGARRESSACVSSLVAVQRKSSAGH